MGAVGGEKHIVGVEVIGEPSGWFSNIRHPPTLEFTTAEA